MKNKKQNPIKDLKTQIERYKSAIGFSNGFDTSTLEKLISIFKKANE